MMKLIRILLLVLATQSVSVVTAYAGDFDWLRNLNIQATADSSGFSATLATRFKIGDAEVRAVISNVDRPSDAYMVLRLGEMSHQPIDYVIKQYHSHKNKGWGALAKSLGIKPGSREFHALKAGHDLGGGHRKDSGGMSHHHGGPGNGKNKGKNNKK